MSHWREDRAAALALARLRGFTIEKIEGTRGVVWAIKYHDNIAGLKLNGTRIGTTWQQVRQIVTNLKPLVLTD